MSRYSRLENEYSDPMRGPHGAGRDPKNIQYWQDRASVNSQIAPRAKGGEMRLPNTNVTVRDTAMRPKVSRNVDRQMRGQDDLNHVGESGYLANIRREA